MATITEALAVAVQYHQTGQLQQAETIYRHILQTDPNRADALHLLGVLAAQTGRCALAVQYMSQASSLQPGNTAFISNLAKAHNDFGLALMEQDQLAEAMTQFREALRLNPDFAEAHINLGNALMKQGQLVEAAAQFHEALRLRPDMADAHNNLGIVLREQGQLGEALLQFHEALRLRPDFAEAHHNLGIALLEQGPLGEAVLQFHEALRLRPDYADAHYNLGIALYKLGQLAEALAHHQQALRLRPGHADDHYKLGVIYSELGDFAKAAAFFQESLRLNPSLGSAYFSLGQLASGGHYCFKNDDIQAIGTLLANGNLPIDEQGVLHFALANYLDNLGSYDEAFAHYRQGNDLRRQDWQQRDRGFDRARAVDLVDNIVTVFNSDYFERVRSFGLDTEIPVFIVGMPRSGTTLVEQILCSHRQVFGAGELKDIRRMIDDLPVLLHTPDIYPACMSRIDRQTGEALAQRYLGAFVNLAATLSES